MFAVNFAVAFILTMFLVPLLQFADSGFHFDDRFVELFIFEFDQSLLLVSKWFFMPERSLKLIIPRVLIVSIEHSLLSITDRDDSMNNSVVVEADLVFLQ